MNKTTLTLGAAAVAAVLILLLTRKALGGSPLSPKKVINPKPQNTPTTGEGKWQVDYGTYPRSLDSLLGSKDFLIWPPTLIAGLSAPMPYGHILQCNLGLTRAQRGAGGQWTPPDNFQLVYRPRLDGSADKISKKLTGDPRALYCLSLLCAQSGLDRLHHVGMTVWNPGNGFWGHDDGCAIDLTEHNEMNALVEAAKQLNMPIGWISRTSPDGKYWPIFQLRHGVKEAVGNSTVNHNSHYHLVLPRPDWSISRTQYKGGKISLAS